MVTYPECFSLVCRVNIFMNICNHVLYHQIIVFNALTHDIPFSWYNHVLVEMHFKSCFLLVLNWFSSMHRHIKIHVNKYSHTDTIRHTYTYIHTHAYKKVCKHPTTHICMHILCKWTVRKICRTFIYFTLSSKKFLSVDCSRSKAFCLFKNLIKTKYLIKKVFLQWCTCVY